MSRLFIAQKRIIRLIFNIRAGETCKHAFRQYGILTLVCIYIYKCAIFAYDHKTFFCTNSQNHKYETRNGECFRVPLHRTSGYEKAPHYACISIYNRLPQQIKDCNNRNMFKCKLRQLLVDKCYYELKEFFGIS